MMRIPAPLLKTHSQKNKYSIWVTIFAISRERSERIYRYTSIPVAREDIKRLAGEEHTELCEG